MNPLAISIAFVLPFLAAVPVHAATSVEEPDGAAPSGAVTGYWYAMRDQPDFGVGVASINSGPWRIEGRYNYEARNSGSLFLGWKFSGGDTVKFEVTPIIGGLFGAKHGFIPGVEASVAWGPFDAYIEAEYVSDRSNSSDSYYYSWSEIGWTPVEWLRIGLAGQRTRTVQNDRDFQRGVFAQLVGDHATLSDYGFNPDSGSRYVIVALGFQF